MHDYVIVGAGSAGCVLAARLSESPDASVLLLEAGGGSLADAERPKALLEYLLRRSGPLSSSVAEAFASLLGREVFPGPAVEDDEAIAEDLRRRVELLYHPAGTCRMGTDEDAVVDPELRLRGIAGLRVADASVMPTITSGNTNAPTIAIAERAADLIAGREPLA